MSHDEVIVRTPSGRVEAVRVDAAAPPAVPRAVPPLRLLRPLPLCRLAALPDDAIAVVLGFVTAKEAARLAATGRAPREAVARSPAWRMLSGGVPLGEYCMLREGGNAWWHAEGMVAARSLRPGAPLARVRLAEQEMGVRLPRELVMALLAHDGQVACGRMRRGGAGTGGVRLLAVREMAAARGREALGGTEWVPVADPQGHQLVCVSASTGAVHVLEGRLARQVFPPVATGFFDFLRHKFV